MAEKDILLESEENTGAIKISNDVILIIATQALSEVKGIHIASTAAEGIVDKLVKKPAQRGAKVYLNEEEKKVDIDIHISIDYGVNIPEVSWAIQEAVKKNVENMTDIIVEKVNVFVDGVTIEKEPKLPKIRRTPKQEDKNNM